MLKVLNCITQEHDLRLVALSACICALGCFTTVVLLARTATAQGASVIRWHAAAAVIFGCSVWSLHFVAMLAFMPSLTIAYNVALTVISAVVAAGGAMAALLIWRAPLGPRTAVVFAGTVLGLAVAGMHYIGVAAMRFSGFLLFDDAYVAASIAISIVFAVVALARASDLSRVARRLEVTGWLAITICGLHFTGMAAITVAPGVAETGGDAVLGTASLALAVGSTSLLLLVASLTATLMEQHLTQRSVSELVRMRLMSNLAHEVLLVHHEGRVLEVNNAGERLFRAPVSAIVGRPIVSLFADNSAPALLRRARCRPNDLMPEEMEIRTADGKLIPVELSCQSIDFFGKPATVVALRDLTDRKRDEARIRHLARHDALTNLPNRFNLEERLGSALDAASQDGTGLAVIYLDLDRFKPINDLLGHAAGDALLVQASKRLLAEIHATDMLARIGGDEFVMVLTHVPEPDKVSATASRLVETLRRPFYIEGQQVEIGVSIGIALYPGDGANSETLLRAADTAMYRVKEEGRGAVRFYESSMNAQLQARRQLEQELGGAMARDELFLLYQPIINAVSGEIETCEALIRWNHPQRGTVPPAEFIPLAEGADLITPIGRWVIDTACAAAASWPEPWRVAVNVSPTQFRQSDVPGIVAAALERHGLDPARLVIEITEGIFIADADAAVAVLSRLRDLGVRLALDDFGTGYSSLSYLQMFRFDKFKIDRSFVNRLGQSEDAMTIIRTIVNLGHNLGLQVTAEGVETVQQLGLLRAAGCEQLQGYLFRRPSTIESMSEFERARIKGLFSDSRARLSA